MTVIYRAPYLSVTVAGGTLTDVLSARVQAGYGMRVAQADVVTRSLPVGIAPWDAVTVTMGATQATANKRFDGYFVQSEQELFEHTIRLLCKGKLQRCETYTAMTDVDMSSEAVNIQMDPPIPFGHEDEVMVQTILYICGLVDSVDPSGDGLILGTGRTLGSINGGKGFNWDEGSSALSWIERLEEVTLGYRTFDAMDGTIQRKLITSIPTGSAEWTFTEGVDIFRASESETVLDVRNKVVVNGWNGDKTERTYTAQAYNPWLVGSEAGGTAEPWYLSQRIDSAMIEQGVTLGGTVGISAREVASWQLAELNRRLERVTLTTPRDDLVQPADTATIVAPTRLGIATRNFWVQDIDVSIDRRGQFSQVLSCLSSADGGIATEGVTATATALMYAPRVSVADLLMLETGGGDDLLLETGDGLLLE